MNRRHFLKSAGVAVICTPLVAQSQPLTAQPKPQGRITGSADFIIGCDLDGSGSLYTVTYRLNESGDMTWCSLKPTCDYVLYPTALGRHKRRYTAARVDEALAMLNRGPTPPGTLFHMAWEEIMGDPLRIRVCA